MPLHREFIRTVQDDKVILSLPEFKGRAVIITVEPKPSKRSLRANRYYFGALVRAISGYTGMTVEQVHDYIKETLNKQEILDPITKQNIFIAGSTANMRSFEFAELVTKVQEVCDKLGIQYGTAEEYYDSLERDNNEQ